MFNFLHISDIHLNKSFATKDDQLRKTLKRHVRKTFQNAVAYALEHDLDALVIAGDLYDHWHLSVSENKFIQEQFEILNQKDISVFYASGNHDYTSYDSPLRKITYPKNVFTFFEETPKVIDFTSKSGQSYKIVGCGHVLEQEHRNLVKDFPIGMDLGIVHCTIASPLLSGDEGQYLPSTLETLTSKAYGYFALGHVHNHGYLDQNNTIAYAGVLQGLNRNETHEKGGYHVSLTKDGVESKFVSLASLIYDKLEVDLTSITTMDQLYDHLMKHLSLQGHHKNKIYTVTLAGTTKLYRDLKVKGQLEDLKDFLKDHLELIDVVIKDHTKLLYDLESLLKEDSVLKEVLKDIEDIESNLPDLKFLSHSKERLKDFAAHEMKDEIINRFLENINEDH